MEQLGQVFWPGTMMIGLLLPLLLLLPPPEEGGPQEGVFGELGQKPGSLLPPPEEEGGPQEGVFGELGQKPGSLTLPPEEEGGPQEGVSGEMGHEPGSLVTLFSAVPISCVPSALSETERVRFSPFLSIYIGFPFCLIADANGMIYPMRNVADSVTVFKIFWIFFPTAKRQPRWRLPH